MWRDKKAELLVVSRWNMFFFRKNMPGEGADGSSRHLCSAVMNNSCC